MCILSPGSTCAQLYNHSRHLATFRGRRSLKVSIRVRPRAMRFSLPGPWFGPFIGEVDPAAPEVDPAFSGDNAATSGFNTAPSGVNAAVSGVGTASSGINADMSGVNAAASEFSADMSEVNPAPSEVNATAAEKLSRLWIVVSPALEDNIPSPGSTREHHRTQQE